MQVHQKHRAYAEGTAPPTSFLDSPMISNALVTQQPDHTNLLCGLLTNAVLHHPVIKSYLTAWEMTDFLNDFPVLTADVTSSFLQNFQLRGPLNDLQADIHPDIVALLADAAHLPHISSQFDRLFDIGRAVPRASPGTVQLLRSTTDGVLQNTKLTLEALMFPYLFPAPT